MEVTKSRPPAEEAEGAGCSSFSKSLLLGEIHDEMVFPWPEPDPAEQDRVRRLTTSLRELTVGQW